MSASTLLSRTSMNGGSSCNSLDDQRAFHLVQELSNLSLLHFDNHSMSKMSNTNLNDSNFQNCHPHPDSFLQDINERNGHDFLPDDNLYSNNQLMEPHQPSPFDEPYGPPGSNTSAAAIAANARKSSNMTETVPVPSSEHVAEIVGRQGCKIKSLRTQTNTYIKTPVRGAEPVFVVTGRKEDVAQAKHQILSAAEHFSSIRAKRNGSGAVHISSNSGTTSPTSIPLGHITSLVRVPYKVVGLVVGPKGATIKRIQQTTSTYIVTPGRDKDPVFEVTGLPDNVEKAKEEIEKHIASRTGNDNNSDLQIDDFQPYGMDAGYHEQCNESNQQNTINNFNNFNPINIVNGNDNLPPLSSISGISKSSQIYQPMPPTPAALHKHMCHGSTKNTVHTNIPASEFNLIPSFKHFQCGGNVGLKGGQDYEVDEGIATHGSSVVSVFDPNAFWGDASTLAVQRSQSLSQPRKDPILLPPGEDAPQPRTRRTNSDPLAAAFQKIDAAFSSGSCSQGSTSPVTGRPNESSHAPQQAQSSGPSKSSGPCYSCRGEATAALVPCGHNSFCMRCAEEICQREAERRMCPICHKAAEGALMFVGR